MESKPEPIPDEYKDLADLYDGTIVKVDTVTGEILDTYNCDDE